MTFNALSLIQKASILTGAELNKSRLQDDNVASVFSSKISSDTFDPRLQMPSSHDFQASNGPHGS